MCQLGGPARAAGMLEGSPREAADANAAGARLQRIDPWVIVDYLHCHITLSDGELGGERAPTRLMHADWGVTAPAVKGADLGYRRGGNTR